MITHYTVEKNCHYCLQAFSTAGILKINVKYCFKIKAKQRIKMHKRGE